jgi:hypothetical protein
MKSKQSLFGLQIAGLFAALFVPAVASAATTASTNSVDMRGGDSNLGVRYYEYGTRQSSVDGYGYSTSVYSRAYQALYVSLFGTEQTLLFMNAEGWGGMFGGPAQTLNRSAQAYVYFMGQSQPVTTSTSNPTVIIQTVAKTIVKDLYSKTVYGSYAGIPLSANVIVTGSTSMSGNARGEAGNWPYCRAGFSGSSVASIGASLRAHLAAGIGFDKIVGVGLATDLTVVSGTNTVTEGITGKLLDGGVTQVGNDSHKDLLQFRGLGGSLYAQVCAGGACAHIWDIGSWSGYGYNQWGWYEGVSTYNQPGFLY